MFVGVTFGHPELVIGSSQDSRMGCIGAAKDETLEGITYGSVGLLGSLRYLSLVIELDSLNCTLPPAYASV